MGLRDDNLNVEFTQTHRRRNVSYNLWWAETGSRGSLKPLPGNPGFFFPYWHFRDAAAKVTYLCFAATCFRAKILKGIQKGLSAGRLLDPGRILELGDGNAFLPGTGKHKERDLPPFEFGG